MVTPAKKENRGGKREGAGRPRQASSIKRDNEKVMRKVIPFAEQGIEVLGESYPMLMRKMIDMAMGDEATERQPNITLLKALVEMLPKVVNLENSEKDVKVFALVERHLNRVREGDAEESDNSSEA